MPKDLQVGLFAHPGRVFSAKVRYSNADVLKRADIEDGIQTDGTKLMQHGNQGMAIKVLNIGEATLLQDGAAQNQDFLMVNTPAISGASQA